MTARSDSRAAPTRSNRTNSWSLKNIAFFAILAPFFSTVYVCREQLHLISALGVILPGFLHPQRDKCWAETTVHPILLWHPFPREVLIAGSGTHFLVRESLRHIATTPVHWVDSVSPDISKDVDILARTIRHPIQSVDKFFVSANITFDAIILDRIPSPSLILRTTEKLAQGGVLGFALPDSWENLIKQSLSVFKHVHLFAPYDSAGKSQYYAIATNSDAYPPPTHLSVAYVNTLIGRRVVHKSTLSVYDGEAHLRMFLLQRHMRQKLSNIYQNYPDRPSPSANPNLSPFLYDDNGSPSTELPKTVTLSRDFILCRSTPYSDLEATDIVLNSLRNGEAVSRRIASFSWKTYQNISTYAVPPGFDTTAVKSSPVLDTSAPSSSVAPAQIIVTAIFDGGSLSFHIFPNLGLSRASVTNSNGWVSSEEILETLGDSQGCERSSGNTHTGPAPLSHSRTFNERLSHFGDDAIGSISNWKLLDPYWTSPKIDIRTSLVDGTGNWAKADIVKDEVVYRGPIEAELVHVEEYKRYPAWKKFHVDHFGEQAHDEILVGPSRGLEAASYFTNHACSPNIKYHDSYDVMIAIRNISTGEELTFDYATSSGLGFPFECTCGAKNCRHAISSLDWADERIVKGLGKEAFWPFLKARIVRMEKEKILT